MTFTGGRDPAFESSPQDPSVQTFLARNVAPGKRGRVHGLRHGVVPREDQNGQGNTGGQGDNGEQNAGAPASGPGGGIGEPINTPDPLSKYKWWILGGLALLLAAAAAFLLRRPTTRGPWPRPERLRFGLGGIAVSSGLLHVRIACGQEHRAAERAQGRAVCPGKREDRRHARSGRVRRAKGGAGDGTEARAEEKLGFRFQGSEARPGEQFHSCLLLSADPCILQQ